MHEGQGVEQVSLGRWGIKELNHILHESSKIKNTGLRIGFLSEKFIGTDYKELTLIGDIKTPEVLVINLKGVDCFTFIDYTEAMRLSGSFSEFKKNLKRLRYKSGKVAFENRNHFFSDWAEFNSGLVTDVTEKISGKRVIKAQKTLNMKKNGAYFLPGIQPIKRVINYIPSDKIDRQVAGRLKTGDYVGIYSKAEGLDVSHVGIIVKIKDKIYLRHASSLKKKVVDDELKKYMVGKPGLAVYRAK